VAESLGRRYAVLRPHLDERQRRLLLGSEAAELGGVGIKTVAEATGAHPDTVARGVGELTGDPEPAVRVRARGWSTTATAYHRAYSQEPSVSPEVRESP
jgi:hypothetical protein